MTDYKADCKSCRVYKCTKGESDNLPKFCPMEDAALYDKAFDLVEKDKEFFVKCSNVEKRGYGSWPRVRETIELIKDMGYKKVGLAFCAGFKNEAKSLGEIFEAHGIELISAMCKTGGRDKDELGIEKIYEGQFEPNCNPVAQALILNEEGTEFNIIMGLCVGHDSLFMKHSEALCTTLVVKDRLTGHNPCVALYLKDSYMKDKLGL